MTIATSFMKTKYTLIRKANNSLIYTTDNVKQKRFLKYKVYCYTERSNLDLSILLTTVHIVYRKT